MEENKETQRPVVELPDRLVKLKERLNEEKPKAKYYLHIRRFGYINDSQKRYEVVALGDFRHRQEAADMFTAFVVGLHPENGFSTSNVHGGDLWAKFERMRIQCNTLEFDKSMLDFSSEDMTDIERKEFEDWKKRDEVKQETAKAEKAKQDRIKQDKRDAERKALDHQYFTQTKKTEFKQEILGELGLAEEAPPCKPFAKSPASHILGRKR